MCQVPQAPGHLSVGGDVSGSGLKDECGQVGLGCKAGTLVEDGQGPESGTGAPALLGRPPPHGGIISGQIRDPHPVEVAARPGETDGVTQLSPPVTTGAGNGEAEEEAVLQGAQAAV